MPNLCVVHLFPYFRTLGGVQSVLQHHHAHDLAAGLDSRFIIYHESAEPAVERVSFLDLTRRDTIRRARARMTAALEQGRGRPDVAVYHGPLAMHYLADLDHAPRRLLMLHGTVPGLEAEVLSRKDWVDGVLCVSRPLHQLVRRLAPELPEERIALMPYPIAPPALASTRAPWPGRPLVIGFCGRVSHEQKRVDRLPEFCSRLDAAGVAHRFEVLGDGPQRTWLESHLQPAGGVTFHGRQNGEAYWRILNGWDVILFTSDYEGTPIALLEAMSAGVIPLYGRIESGGEDYAGKVAANLVYPTGDFAPAVAALKGLQSTGPEEVERLRKGCREAVEGHLGHSYLNQFSAFLRRIVELPPRTKAAFPKRPLLKDHLPFALLARLGAIRRAGRRLLGG